MSDVSRQDDSVDVFGSQLEDDQLFSTPLAQFEILQLEHMSIARRLSRKYMSNHSSPSSPRNNTRLDYISSA